MQPDLADSGCANALDAVVFSHDREQLEEGGGMLRKHRCVGGVEIVVANHEALELIWMLLPWLCFCGRWLRRGILKQGVIELAYRHHDLVVALHKFLDPESLCAVLIAEHVRQLALVVKQQIALPAGRLSGAAHSAPSRGTPRR